MMDKKHEERLMPPVRLATKPTLLTLRRQLNISSQAIAEAAGVSLTDVYVMEIGGMVSQEVATKVLTAFSKLVGATYTLADISARVRPEQRKSAGMQRPREGRMKSSMSHYDTQR